MQKRLAFLRARPSESNFDEVRVTKKTSALRAKKTRFFTFTAEWQQLRQSHGLCPLFIFCKKKVTKFASCGVAVSELKTVFWCVLRVGFAHISSPYAAE